MHRYLFLIFLWFALPVFAQDEDDAAAEAEPIEETEEAPQGFSDRKSKTGEAKDLPAFGGRTSPAGEIVESDTELDPAFRFPKIDAAMQPWADWKQKTNDEHAVALSAHYSTMFQSVSDALPGTDDKASGGVLRTTLRWTPVGKGTKNAGTLNIMLDHRHAFRDTPPAGLAGSAGYIGVTSLFYGDSNFDLINLNWQQGFNDGQTGFIAGRYDPNDYMDVLGYVNPWTIFTNLAINLDVSVAVPDSSWGIGAGHWLNDQWYVLGGINDANGFGQDYLEFFDGGAEFFKYAHLGWSPSQGERYFKNIHILAWHVDKREDAGVPSSSGFTIGANWTFNDRWMPFARIGFSDGGAPIYNDSMTVGLIRKFMYRSDLVGIAINRGSPPDNSLSDQTTVEAFWRFQFSQNFAITPHLQYLADPALNTEEDLVTIFGVRMRLAF